MSITESVPAQRKATEVQSVWIALDGEHLSPDLLTPTEAADFAVNHFDYLGHEITVQDGKIGVRNPRISSEYRWYRPTAPNRAPMLWFRDGDQSDYPMGSEPDNWLTVDEAKARCIDGGASKVTASDNGREILAHHEGYIPTRWVGVPFTAEDITCDDAQKFADRGPKMPSKELHEALSAWVMAKADGMRNNEFAKIEDALMVELMVGAKA